MVPLKSLLYNTYWGKTLTLTMLGSLRRLFPLKDHSIMSKIIETFRNLFEQLHRVKSFPKSYIKLTPPTLLCLSSFN